MKPQFFRILAGIALAFCATFGSREANAQEGEYAQQQRGRYLAIVGDCAACHTAEGGAALAGGRPIATPFGVIYSPNITPDSETGIGSWTDDQFYRAMHEGISADGSHLYPAFPYPWFTKVTRDDVNAIRDYLRTVPPVKYRRAVDKLPWPLDDRTVMAGWNALYFKAGALQPNTSKSSQWNRGAYIVEGLAHCGACHSQKNVFGASRDSNQEQGGVVDNWFAPNLSNDLRTGLGSWSTQDIIQFLKTGQIDRTVAYGPMAQVIEESTSKMTDADLTAIATYLKGLPSAGVAKAPNQPTNNATSAGQAIYVDTCSACHQAHGEGVPGLFPSLKGDAVVQSDKATTVLRLILNGGHAAATSQKPTAESMPAFDWKLSDPQIAAVASYIRSAWGNTAAPVSSGEVSDLRKSVGSVSSAN
jgi:mono/diheme cytochrome c family protein